MEINWFTVIAQIINFLVLVWLMKKYLYKPVLDAVGGREKKIAAELAEARSNMVEAKKKQDEFQQKNEEFDKQKQQLMAQASSEAGVEKQKMLDSAKVEAEVVKQKLEDASKQQQADLNDQILQKTQQQVFSITRKALAELASANLEEQSVQVFIGKIKAINENDKKQFIAAFHSDVNPVSVKSAFDLSEKEQKSITKAIADILGEDGKYEFKTDPKIIGGVELSTKGYKLAWSFSAYINSLEQSIDSRMRDTDIAVKK
ncbi:MAG: F0F1 ATP synthase subunit delta [Dyadobacter sp.]